MYLITYKISFKIKDLPLKIRGHSSPTRTDLCNATPRTHQNICRPKAVSFGHVIKGVQKKDQYLGHFSVLSF